MNLTVEVLRSWKEVEEIRPFWDDTVLNSGCDSLFLGYEWLSSWYDYYGKDIELFFILIKNNGQPYSFAPFCIEHIRVGGLKARRLQFLGNQFSYYTDPVIPANNKKICFLIIKTLKEHQREWDWAKLLHMDGESPNWDLLSESIQRFDYLSYIKPCPIGVFVRTEGTFKQYFDSLSREHRSHCKKQENRLHRLGPLKLEILSEDNPQTNMYFEDLWLHRKARLVNMGKWHFEDYQEIEQKRLYWNLLQKLGTANMAELVILFCCDIPIAYELCFISKKKLYRYLTTFDQKYSYYSPGKVLLKYLINYAFDKGFKEVDFLIGLDPYKFKWSKENRRVNNLLFFPRTIKGYTLFVLDGNLWQLIKRYQWVVKVKNRLEQYDCIIKLKNRLEKITFYRR
jgi:CelD/BcsL family acetyltransferase involved in cellulose biosynthesis